MIHRDRSPQDIYAMAMSNDMEAILISNVLGQIIDILLLIYREI